MTPILLTIAGTDPSGGAGIQADLNVFAHFGFHGASVITAVLSQNTQGVDDVHALPASVVASQLDAVLRDLNVAAVKIGLVPTAETLAALDPVMSLGVPIVWDPVLASGVNGVELVEDGFVRAARQWLANVDVVTPNLPEARMLVRGDGAPRHETRGGAPSTPMSEPSNAVDYATALVELGARGVLLKVGHLVPAADEFADLWADPSGARLLEPLPAVRGDVRGTGCRLSSAIAAGMARGLAAVDAVEAARAYLNEQLHQARAVGHGRPVIVRNEE